MNLQAIYIEADKPVVLAPWALLEVDGQYVLPMGPQGLTGQPGPAGAQGIQGERGETGPMGPAAPIPEPTLHVVGRRPGVTVVNYVFPYQTIKCSGEPAERVDWRHKSMRKS